MGAIFLSLLLLVGPAGADDGSNAKKAATLILAGLETASATDSVPLDDLKTRQDIVADVIKTAKSELEKPTSLADFKATLDKIGEGKLADAKKLSATFDQLHSQISGSDAKGSDYLPAVRTFLDAADDANDLLTSQIAKLDNTTPTENAIARSLPETQGAIPDRSQEAQPPESSNEQTSASPGDGSASSAGGGALPQGGAQPQSPGAGTGASPSADNTPVSSPQIPTLDQTGNAFDQILSSRPEEPNLSDLASRLAKSSSAADTERSPVTVTPLTPPDLRLSPRASSATPPATDQRTRQTKARASKDMGGTTVPNPIAQRSSTPAAAGARGSSISPVTKVGPLSTIRETSKAPENGALFAPPVSETPKAGPAKRPDVAGAYLGSSGGDDEDDEEGGYFDGGTTSLLSLASMKPPALKTLSSCPSHSAKSDQGGLRGMIGMIRQVCHGPDGTDVAFCLNFSEAKR